MICDACQTASLPHTLTLLTTDRCPSACRGCGLAAGPGGRHRLSLVCMRRVIDQAAELGVQLVVFSGGECFLLGSALDQAVAHAVSRGLLTRCVTNAFWARTLDRALRRLERIQKAGLGEINFSTGDRHRQFVPLAAVINAMTAAVRLRMRCSVMVELHRRRKLTREVLLADERLRPAKADPAFAELIKVVESPWIESGLDQPADQDAEHRITAANLDGRGGCSSVLGTLTVDPWGEVGACCGITRRWIPELSMGSLDRSSLAELAAEAREDLVKLWLMAEGPEHILAWATTHDPEIRWEGRFAHQCHACAEVYRNPRVRRVIRRHHAEKLLDIAFQKWLLRRGLVSGRGSSGEHERPGAGGEPAPRAIRGGHHGEQTIDLQDLHGPTADATAGAVLRP